MIAFCIHLKSMSQSPNIKVIALVYFTIFKFNYVGSEIFYSNNATKMFQYFQWKHRTHYKNKEDIDRSYSNFVNNLNTVTRLNEKLKIDDNKFVLNKYADKGPEELKDLNGEKIMPYDLVRDPETSLQNQNEDKIEKEDTPETSLRNQKEGSQQLYDIDNAAELYEEYKKVYHKETPKKEKDRYLRYLRFVKTLIELNRDNKNGKKVLLDDQADIVKEPNAFVYE